MDILHITEIATIGDFTVTMTPTALVLPYGIAALLLLLVGIPYLANKQQPTPEWKEQTRGGTPRRLGRILGALVEALSP